MDATTGSDANGFDAALRALEDLETSVAQSREDKPAVAGAVAPAPAAAPLSAIAPVVEPVLPVASALAFDESEPDDQPVAIAALPIAEIAPGQAVPPLAFPIETAAAEPAPVPAPAPEAAAPAAAAVMTPAAAGRWTKVAIGLGLASSVVSAAGLIIAERTIMSAQLVVATARERQAQLEQAGKLIHDLQIVRDRQIELLKAQQAQLASAPVTSAELQHRMEVLQEGIMKREPVTQVIEAIHASQSDTNSRLGDLGMKIDRLESAAGH
ncbi:MAG: hypothetical protein EPO38_07315 [Rhizorhabdus sp.]|nr:MAG: hypothetical protein EPO38_07315 [Rhizorhabdus sp.]